MHYGQRAMGALLLWISELYLPIQIFQMEISTLSKYSRQVTKGPVGSRSGREEDEQDHPRMNVAPDQTIILG